MLDGDEDGRAQDPPPPTRAVAFGESKTSNNKIGRIISLLVIAQQVWDRAMRPHRGDR